MVALRKEELNEKCMSCPQQLLTMHSKLVAHLKTLDSFSSQVVNTDTSMNGDLEGYESPLITDGSDHPDPTPRGPRPQLEASPSFSEPANNLTGGTQKQTEASGVSGAADTPISQLIASQRRTIESLTKQQQILENQNSSLKKKIEENSLYFKRKAKELKLLAQQRGNEVKDKTEAERVKQVQLVLIQISKIEGLEKEVAARVAAVEARDRKLTEVLIELEGVKKYAKGANQSAQRQRNCQISTRPRAEPGQTGDGETNLLQHQVRLGKPDPRKG